MHFKPLTEVFKSGEMVAKMCVYVASGCGHWLAELEVWFERAMVGWSVAARVSLAQDVRVLWVWESRQRMLEARERERRVE